MGRKSSGEEGKGNGRRRERERKAREKGSEIEENRKGGNQVEKWEGGEGNQVSGNFIHPCNLNCNKINNSFNI